MYRIGTSLEAERASLREWRNAGSTYRVCLDALTVIRTDRNGEEFDLNAEGSPCESVLDLRGYIEALCAEGAFGGEVRDALLASFGEIA